MRTGRLGIQGAWLAGAWALASAAPAGAETVTWPEVSGAFRVNRVAVGDVRGHTIGETQQRGGAVFAGGEVAYLLVRFTFDGTKTSTTYRIPQPMPGHPDLALASTGNYLFRPEVLVEAVEADALRETPHDFGRDIVPALIHSHRVFAYDFRHNRIPGILPGEDPTYWRDMGSIDAYFAARMELLGESPPINLRNRRWPIRTATSSDPPARILCGDGCGLVDSLVAEGAAVWGSEVRRSILGRNVVVQQGCRLEEVVVNDGAEIGEGSRLRRAVVDKGAVIPREAAIGFDRRADERLYHVSPLGITGVPRAPLGRSGRPTPRARERAAAGAPRDAAVAAEATG